MNAKSKISTLLACSALLLSLCGAGLLPGGRAQAGGKQKGDDDPEAAVLNREKVSGKLRERASRGKSGKGEGENV